VPANRSVSALVLEVLHCAGESTCDANTLPAALVLLAQGQILFPSAHAARECSSVGTR